MGYLETALAIWGDYDGEKASRFAGTLKPYEEIRKKSPAAAQWDALSALRWGPGLADDEPPIDVPRDWRWDVANWPPGRWSRWRALSGELLAGQDDEPTADDIRAADRVAYDLIRAEGSQS